MFKKSSWIIALFVLNCFSYIYGQTTFEFTEEEVQNIYNSINELEYADSLNKVIILNLESQIIDYDKLIVNNKLTIEDYKQQIILKDEMIELVKPRWYENKYLWFGLGVVFTTSSVHLAGQLK